MATRKPSSRRLVVTLLLALVLHLAGAALVYLFWPTSSTQHARLDAPTEVELIHLPALDRSPARAPARAVARVPAPAPARARSSPEAPSSAPARGGPKALPPARSRVGRSASARGGPKALPPARLSLRMRTPDLAPSQNLFDHELPAIRARRAGARKQEQESETSRVTRRLRGWLRQDAGVRNVKLGRAHPAIFSLLRRVERRFTPSAEMLPPRMRHAGREILQAYKAGIETFNRMGTALPLDRWETGEHSALAVLPETVKTMAGREAVSRAGLENNRRLVAEVCFKAAPGRQAKITSCRKFKISSLDAHVAQAVRRAFAEAPMPADLPPTEACYRFSVSFGRTLPTPSAGCCIDENFKLDCSWPTKKTFAHKVRLVTVWPEQAQ